MAWEGIEEAEVEYVAVLVNSVLWGISCTQTFRKDDSKWIQALVIWLFACDTAHLILTNRGFWIDIVLSDNGWVVSEEYLWASFFTCLVALPCQLFFANRIWNFSGRNWLIPLFFIPTSLYQLVGYIAFLALNLQQVSIAQFYDLQKLLKSIWGVQAGEDMLITLILFYMLWKQKEGEILKQWDAFFLTFMCINTGTWTALVALFALITMTVWPNTFAFVSLNLVICPIYCNTLLGNLNARDYIRAGTSNQSNVTMIPSFRTTRRDGEETLEVDMEANHLHRDAPPSLSSGDNLSESKEVPTRG